MGYSDNPNGSDLRIVTVVLQYRVFARESTTAQSLGGNAAELVDWAYRWTHETSNQWIGFTWKPTQPLVVSWVP